MLKAIVKTFKNYPIKSITYDNGTENMNHLIANKILNCDSYFADLIALPIRALLRTQIKSYDNFCPRKLSST